jgi:prepilin-type N-terminal cleavage/methylation domain-containing protein
MAAPLKRHHGFSLIEVLVSLSLLGLAASTLLLATGSTVQSSSDALAQTIARGIAEQLIDEVLGQPYHEPGSHPLTGPLGPESGESPAPSQTFYFDDADDYHQFASSPPSDPWGKLLGSGDGQGGLRAESFRLPQDYFGGWTVEATITYVDETNPSLDLAAPATSGIRAVRVRVTRSQGGGVRELATLRQVFAYVPPLGN